MRFKSLFLACLLMLVSALPAMAAPTLNLNTVSGTPGQLVTLTATLAGGGGNVAALAMDIAYDQTKLSNPIGDTSTGTVKWAIAENATPGLYRIGLTRSQKDPATGLPYAIPDGEVFTVTFTIANTASGNITLTNTPSGADKTAAPVAMTGTNGAVTLPAAALPTVTAFSIPATGSSLTIPVTTFTASNATAYLITESATAPAASAITATTVPTTFTVTGYTAHTLYAWAKNASGVVSAPFAGATTTLTPPAAPLATVTAFAIPATGTSLTVPISTFTAANAVAYLITESATAPAASAITATTAPTTFTVTGFTAHTLYAWVKNSDGVVSVPFAGKTTTLTEPVGPDSTPPTLTVTSPAEGLKTKESTLNIAGTVTDPSGIASLTVNGATVTVGTNGAFTYLLSLTTEGPVAISVVATDNAAAHNPITVTRNITYDKTPMTLTVSAPSSDNSKTKELSVTVAGTISEDGGSVGIKNTTSNVTIAATVTGTNYTGSIQLNEGDNNIQVTGTDQAGNTTALSRTITRDSLPPALAITDPNHDVQVTVAAVTIKGTVDASATEVKLTFNSIDYPQTIAAGAFQQAITIPAVDAVYPVVVTAKDALGNSSSVTRNIVYTQVPGDILPNAGVIEKLVEALKAYQSAHNLLPAPLTELEKVKLDCAPLNTDGTPNPDGVIDGGDVILLLRRAAGLAK